MAAKKKIASKKPKPKPKPKSESPMNRRLREMGGKPLAAPPAADDSRRGGLLRAPREPATAGKDEETPTEGQDNPAVTLPRKKERKPPKEKPQRECLCGCLTMTKSAFAAGHDSRVKGMLIKQLFGSIENMMAWSKTPEGIRRAKEQAAQ